MSRDKIKEDILGSIIRGRTEENSSLEIQRSIESKTKTKDESDDYEQIAYSGGGSELSDFEGIIGDFIRNGGRIEELFTYAVKEK